MKFSHLRPGALLLLLFPAALHASDSIFSVEKQAVYFQVSSATPTLGGVPSIPAYSGSIEATEAATVTPPGLAAVAVTYSANNQDYSLNGLFSTKAAFDSAYPDGTYQSSPAAIPRSQFRSRAICTRQSCRRWSGATGKTTSSS